MPALEMRAAELALETALGDEYLTAGTGILIADESGRVVREL